MSQVATRMHRTDAIAIARRFVDLLDGTYDQLIVAGSLRRRLAMIGDIEIVCVPKIEAVEEVVTDLFGQSRRMVPVDQLDECMDWLWQQRIVEQTINAAGNATWGTSYKRCTFEGAHVDLFTPCAERLGWILLLRTGPAAFSRQLVVPREKVPGEPRTNTKTKDGRRGLLPAHIVSKDGWLCYRTSGERIETPDEASVFKLLGLSYVEPWERV